MRVTEIPIDRVQPASWNANEMTQAMRSRLRGSMGRYDMVVPLVVRSIGLGLFETIGGAQRLSVHREMGATTVPCVIVEVDDAEARLLGQALNHIAGEDDLGLRAEVIRDILKALPEEQVLAVLPDSTEELKALASLREGDIAEHLRAWQRAQEARLHTFQIRLTDPQLEVVQEALKRAEATGGLDPDSPNRRAAAMAEICRTYLKVNGEVL